MWYGIQVPSYLIREAGSGMVIMMPQDCRYHGYELWVSKKLLLPLSYESYYGTVSLPNMELRYKPGFKFRLKKYSLSRFHKKLLDEKEVTPKELQDILAPHTYSCPDVLVPEDLEPEDVEALEELKDDEYQTAASSN